VELLRSSNDATRRRALSLLRLSAEGYRTTENRDVLPVALGMWAEAERVCGNIKDAARIAGEGEALLLQGALSLLNESPIFLALYKARGELGDEEGARAALSSGIRLLLRRVNGLLGSPYAGTFLTQLGQNAELATAADAAGLLPESIRRMLMTQN
jgi:eukaryotic-like serine/threonine-protein kinase